MAGPDPLANLPDHPLLRILKHSDIGIAFAVVGIIMMLIVPMPPEFLDVLMVCNIKKQKPIPFRLNSLSMKI